MHLFFQQKQTEKIRKVLSLKNRDIWKLGQHKEKSGKKTKLLWDLITLHHMDIPITSSKKSSSKTASQYTCSLFV